MIRKAELTELDTICDIYAQARQLMEANGNPNQWKGGYPGRDVVRKDIERGELYVDCEADGSIACVFMFTMQPEPTYEVIRDGSWCNDAPYGTIHRVASTGIRKGAASRCIAWCYAQCGGNMRGDTHEDNLIMQHVLEKNGFVRCGWITLEDGSSRIAYQKTAERLKSILSK